MSSSSTRLTTRSKLFRIGALTAGVYLLTCLFYVGGAQSRSRTARELFAWFCVLTLLPLFWKGYQTIKQSSDAEHFRLVIGFAALFCVLTFLTVPFHSTDVFGYINRGWQQIHYGQNPYAYTISDIPGWQHDPMLREHWIHNPNPYGFLFALITRGIAKLGNGNWWLTLALFKLLSVVIYGLTAWLVYSGAKLLGHQRPLLAGYVFLWNPLIFMHHVANGHNDLLVGCFIALSFYLALRGAHFWIVPALTIATLLKYGPVLLIPLALIFVVKKSGWRVAAVSCILSALLAILICMPYLQDWEVLSLAVIRENATLIDNSLHSFLIHIYGTVAGVVPSLAPFREMVNTVIKTVLRGGFIIFVIVVFWRMWTNVSVRSLMEKSVLLMFVLICIVSSKFNGWYMGMLLAPALFLLPDHWLRRLIVLVTCAQLMSITFFKQAYMLNFFAMILIPAIIVFRQERVSEPPASAGGAATLQSDAAR